MSETITINDWPIQQGVNWIPPDLVRQFYPHPVRRSGCSIINTCTGKKVDESDLISEDYTGCSALMKLRVGGPTGTVVAELSTATGEIVLDGATLKRNLPASVTQTIPANVSLFGQIDITRSNGTVERQYAITCSVVGNGNTP